MNPLTMTDQELIEHASKQVQALRMALDMIECEKYERRHVRWAIIDALKEEPAAPAQPAPVQEPVNLLEARKIAAEYGAPDSQVDNGNLYFALSKCLEHIDAQPAPVQEPIGYLFQHEETGLTTVVDVQQVEWGFEKNNPRHQKIGPVYTTPPAAQRQCEDDK
jgi:hypothetical protein